MYELGLVVPFWIVVLVWLAKVILLALICTLLAWLGGRVLDALTPPRLTAWASLIVWAGLP
ncbi:unnamed protein product [marine sediment metagenome]|uniref:Uncharacterized protein n=1 Tax=marine sediment metagenome TaxID=412755 RepID=X1DDE6_9ZZZZ